MTLDDTRLSYIILNFTKARRCPFTEGHFLFPQLSVLAPCFIRMLLPLPLFPRGFFACAPLGLFLI